MHYKQTVLILLSARAVSLYFPKHIHTCTICQNVNSQKFAPLQKELQAINPSVQVQTKKLDVTSPSEVDQWVDGIISTFGDLHGVANVAGVPESISIRKSPAILEETVEMWKNTMAVNIDGIFYCNKAEVRAMLGLSRTPRSIVNVSSLIAFRHTPDVFAYGASKAACSFFTTCLANDVHGQGIRVNAVCPGEIFPSSR